MSTRKSPVKDSKPKRAKTARKDKKVPTKKDLPPKPAFKETLNKEEKGAKEAIIKGGQFDAIG